MNEFSPETSEAMPKEIERRFLVRSIPTELDLNRTARIKMHQGYLTNGPDGSVRIRSENDKFFWTFKRKTGRHEAERDQPETEISKDQFDTMWPATEGRRLEKTRYKIPSGKHTIELDIFEGKNSGHMIAEVEFDSTEEADIFAPPEWFSNEVTSDPKFSNANIAEAGFPLDFWD